MLILTTSVELQLANAQHAFSNYLYWALLASRSLMLSMLVFLSSVSINETGCLPTFLRPTSSYQNTSFDASVVFWMSDTMNYEFHSSINNY